MSNVEDLGGFFKIGIGLLVFFFFYSVGLHLRGSPEGIIGIFVSLFGVFAFSLMYRFLRLGDQSLKGGETK